MQLAVTQGLLHGLAFTDIADEADIHDLPGNLCAANGQANRQEPAILVQAFDLAPHTDDLGLSALAEAAQIVIMLATVWFRHQQADVLAEQLILTPAKELFHRGVYALDHAVLVNDDDAVDRGIEHRGHARLAGKALTVQIAITQQAVDRANQHAEAKGGHGNHAGQVKAAFHGLWYGKLGLTQHTGGGHSGVVHAADGQAHHRAAGRNGRQAGHTPTQAIAHPQSDDCQQHRHHNGQGKQPGVIAQQWLHLDGRHAAVVHEADTRAHQYAATDQLPATDLAACQQAQGHPGGRQAGQHGQASQQGVVADLDRQ